MELSKRLQGVISLMPPADTICDVGCDHGYVAISFLKNGTAKRVIAMDVNKGPLEQAGKNAVLCDVSDRLELRLSDGLQKVIPGEADAFVCAGMGGRLMVHIMTQGREVMAHMTGAVLQPQSELNIVRRYIYENDWHIVKEDMIFEPDTACLQAGKYYPMMYIEPGREPVPDEPSLLYGPLLIQQRHPVLLQYLEFSLRSKQRLLENLHRQAVSEQAKERVTILEEEIRTIKNLL